MSQCGKCNIKLNIVNFKVYSLCFKIKGKNSKDDYLYMTLHVFESSCETKVNASRTALLFSGCAKLFGTILATAVIGLRLNISCLYSDRKQKGLE